MTEREDCAVLLVSHGGLAAELLAAARQITGRPLEHFEAIVLSWNEGGDVAAQRIGEALERQRESGRPKALILADLYGDTPCKAAMGFVPHEDVELLSGVNLPMVVKLGCLHERVHDLDALAEWAAEKAKGAIRIGSSLVRPAPESS